MRVLPALLILLLSPGENNFFKRAIHESIPGIRNSMGDSADSVDVKITRISGNVYFLECVNGFGGGNVAASIGPDGILLVDDMFASMLPRIDAALKTISPKPVRMVLNTHFHGDHIQGNENYHHSAIIIGHKNITARLSMKKKEAEQNQLMLPAISFTDSIKINFNGEDVQLVHVPDSHTDSDALIYFTKSRVLHLGDLFFFEMFPGVYAEGGGDVKKLVHSLEKIIAVYPADTYVVPGHGRLASMQDLKSYLTMLKETIGIIEKKLREGKTLEQMQQEKVLHKYDDLGKGGAQSTEQYTAMLYKLLSKK
ncbi:MAG: MBL fold metallo-hydrolase [Chitinophagaceae bacterium]|nr:MBL fold metallo-hydrolase [Chitinophagaceae bacterium]